MFTPALYKGKVFDDFMDFSFPDVRKLFPEKNFPMMMSTDIREDENGYCIDIDLPGFRKEDIHVDLEKGSLTVTAERNSESEEKEAKNFVHRERFYGKVSRSFYVGEALTEEDIRGRYSNGTLTLSVPKKSAKETETKKMIAID